MAKQLFSKNDNSKYGEYVSQLQLFLLTRNNNLFVENNRLIACAPAGFWLGAWASAGRGNGHLSPGNWN